MLSVRPIRIGIAGLGGWAAACGDQLSRAAAASGGAIQFAAACDPSLGAHAPRVHELAAKGVRVADSFERLLEQPIDAVWLPVPIALHRPFAAQALAAGRAVLVEKPAAGIAQDVDAMIADRDRAGLPVAVAFQTMYDAATWRAKRLLLDGVVGRVRRASVVGCWPRGTAYYARNRWAGRLRDGEAWVLDSPANNAMAHFLNLSLFLLGPTDEASAAPALVEAELYRANPIETYDTCTLRVTLRGGHALLVAMTHACADTVDPVVVVEGDAGTLRFEHNLGFSITRAGVAERIVLPPSDDLAVEMLRHFSDQCRGECPPGPRCPLEIARAQTVVANAASECRPVVDVPAWHLRAEPAADGVRLVVPDIERALTRCASLGQLLSESQLVSWAEAPGIRAIDGVYAFSGPSSAVRGGPISTAATSPAGAPSSDRTTQHLPDEGPTPCGVAC